MIIVFPVYPAVTQLDFTGPYEVLSRLPGARVIVASAEGGPVRAEGGLTFLTERLSDVETCDLICLPGGMGQPVAMADAEFMAGVRRLGAAATWVTSVCSGSLILGAAGLLQGKRAACHWAWRDMLPLFGATPVDARVVRDGQVFTGGGVTAGIDFALTVAAEIAGRDVAEEIQLVLEYNPAPPFDSGSPERARPELAARVRSRFAAMAADRRAAALNAFGA